MLRGMRKASSTWLGRIIMGIVLGALALIFALWGIGDIFRGFGRSTVAKVGSTEIGFEQFRQIYNDRLQQLGRQLGKPVTPEQARLFRLDRQLADQLISEAALDQRARQMRLNVSDAEVAKQIRTDPNFKGLSGQFERARFEQMIRSAGYSEPRYAAEQKRLTMRREIVQTVSGEVAPPKAMAEAQNRYDNEQRAIDYVTLDRAKAGEIEAPTPEAIQKYFDDNKAEFRAPEYRTVALMTLVPSDLAKADEVSDADAKAYYETNQNRYGSPERRHILQIVFPDEKAASEAAARLGAEVSFEALAKEQGLAESDIDLGTLTKSDMIDRKVADAAFALPEGQVSAPVKGDVSTVLLKVTKIEPADVKPFEQVASEIKQQIALDRAKGEVDDRRDKIEDERAGGLRLAEIAQKFGLTARTIEAVDREGLDPDGKKVEGLPAGIDVIGPAFGADVGAETEPLQLPAGGLVWFEVTGVKPARDRTLDEVRPKVEERWRDDQIAERLRAKTAEMVEKLKGGASLNDVASAEGLPVKTTFGIKRAANTATVPPAVAAAVFQTPKDGAGSALGADGGRWVFHVTDATVPELDPASAEGKRITDRMRTTLSEELFAQYVARLQSDLGASVNEDALRRVTGAATDQN